MTEIRLVDHVEQPTAVVHEHVPTADLPAFFHRAFEATARVAAAQGVPVVGPPFGLYHGMPGATVDVEAGFPVARPVTAAEGVTPASLPAGPVAEAVHVGPYETLADTYGEVQRWLAEQGHRPAGLLWEAYLSDPQAEPDPSTWRTQVHVPLGD